MEKLLQNQVAFVTGAGSGIGKAAAIKLAKNGGKIALVDLHKENVEEVKKQIEAIGSEALVLEANVSQPAEVENCYQKTMDQWGRLDVVFANAGINGEVTPIEDMEPKDWDLTISNNLTSTFLTVKYAIPHLKSKGGSIIITSSINGNRIYKNIGMSAYSTSKIGQMGFGKMAALELAHYRIRVNIICPGAIETNIGENTWRENEKLKKVQVPIEYPEGDQPLEDGPGKPEQVADLVLFLASSQSSHITGSEIYIDGAQSLL
ncbi:SDR family oxidoreductase [Neobacillus vireti]|uniref:3-ketoacyl-(Acyl-carrier-protein) reductase n=1 Tax=Neobacillus vireti LMG 21834 TaxID=1131730 RepID=A0AB94IHU5_9BACI|nr:SDR family NAD(P)-dependent oxidoreductase [Neobacillus vireti]ETI66603.1 3-ketoacyl-(acyl-carrier-protein) reductase [Neobacillus vireti LMG 21834]KLT16741.1 3-ketoacyl-ACP reductase [Neobacillus vireti]